MIHEPITDTDVDHPGLLEHSRNCEKSRDNKISCIIYQYTFCQTMIFWLLDKYVFDSLYSLIGQNIVKVTSFAILKWKVFSDLLCQLSIPYNGKRISQMKMHKYWYVSKSNFSKVNLAGKTFYNISPISRWWFQNYWQTKQCFCFFHNEITSINFWWDFP